MLLAGSWQALGTHVASFINADTVALGQLRVSSVNGDMVKREIQRLIAARKERLRLNESGGSVVLLPDEDVVDVLVATIQGEQDREDAERLGEAAERGRVQRAGDEGRCAAPP